VAPPTAVAVVTPQGPLGRGVHATLDASQSSDPGGFPLSFRWSQASGDAVELQGADSAVASFDAPDRPQTLVFQLVVGNGIVEAAPAFVRVAVDWNLAPVAQPGDSRDVVNGTSVLLSGRGTDADDAVAGFLWAVASEPQVENGGRARFSLEGADGPAAVFTPHVKGLFTLSLVVTDSRGARSLPGLVVVRSLNAPPIAAAGLSQRVRNGAALALEGTVSDADPPETETLSYRWTIVSTPAAAWAELSGDDTLRPAFTPHGKGLYVLTLVASDGELSSAPSEVRVVSTNNPPTVTAEDQTVLVGAVLLLAARTADADGDPVSLAWKIVGSGCAGALSDAAGGGTSFRSDAAETCQLEVTPSDGENDGAAARFSVTTRNVLPPIAVASVTPAGTLDRGAHATLDGTQSHDPAGLPLTYRWAQTVGDPVDLQGARTATAFFDAPDRPQTLVFTLIVNNGFVDGTPAYVRVSVDWNVAPVADAGESRDVVNGASVLLSGRGTDPDDVVTGFQWAVTSEPQVENGGRARHTLESADSPAAVFTPRVKGLFTLSLVVTDSRGAASQPAQVVVRSLNAPPVASAGGLRSVQNLARVVLHGTAADADPAGSETISCRWSLVSAPPSAGLPDLEGAEGECAGDPPCRCDLGFTPHGKGLYTLSLAVSDGEAESASATVMVSSLDNPPSASAPATQTVRAGSPLRLAATGVDDDGDAVQLEWTITDDCGVAGLVLEPAPNGRDTLFTAPRPCTVAQRAFTLQATPSDGELAGAAATVTVVVTPVPPVATVAQTHLSTITGAALLIAGGGRSADGSAIAGWHWAVAAAPTAEAGTGTLSGAETPYAIFTPRLRGYYSVELTVTDAEGQTSLPATAAIDVGNAPPVAFAGLAQRVRNGAPLQLQGSVSDADPAGTETISYRWTIAATPSAAWADLAGDDTLTPTFTPHGKGLYTLSLIASDGELSSVPSDARVIATNNAPVVAADDQSVLVGADLVLAARTSDADGDAVRLSWRIVGEGCAGALHDAAGGGKTFRSSAIETCQVEVTPSDGEADGTAVVFQVTTRNIAPVAFIATTNPTTTTGRPVQLVGDASDADGDGIATWQWTVAPTIGTLSGADTRYAVFTPAAKGFYTATLVVVDANGDASTPVSVPVTVLNVAPVANAGSDQSVQNLGTATLAGSAADVDDAQSALSFRWALGTLPAAASMPLMSGSATSTLSFTPHGKGLYTLSLTVSDGEATSEPSTVLVDSRNNPPVVVPAPLSTLDFASISLYASTSDPDGDPVSTTWDMIDAGTDSAGNPRAYALTPAGLFTPRAKGTYKLGATPNDGQANGTRETVLVTATNLPPVAVATASTANASTAETFSLSSDGSDDPDGPVALHYQWSIRQGSATFVGPTTEATATVKAGAIKETLLFRLIVTDDAGAASPPASVSVDVDNVQPVAVAGADGLAGAGDAVALDGSTSYDPDQSSPTLRYDWTCTSPGPVALSPSGGVAKPSFVVPISVGAVVSCSLRVSDGRAWSDTVLQRFTIIPGDATNLFVDAASACGGSCDGTPERPFRTITAAAAASAALPNPKTVLVAAGAYGAESVPAPVAVTGGCSTVDWACDGSAGSTVLRGGPSDAVTLDLTGTATTSGTVSNLTVYGGSGASASSVTAVRCDGCRVTLRAVRAEGEGASLAAGTEARALLVANTGGPVLGTGLVLVAGRTTYDYALEVVNASDVTIDSSSLSTLAHPINSGSTTETMAIKTGGSGSGFVVSRSRITVEADSSVVSARVAHSWGSQGMALVGNVIWYKATPSGAGLCCGSPSQSAQILMEQQTPFQFIGNTFVGTDAARARGSLVLAVYKNPWVSQGAAGMSVATGNYFENQNQLVWGNVGGAGVRFLSNSFSNIDAGVSGSALDTGSVSGGWPGGSDNRAESCSLRSAATGDFHLSTGSTCVDAGIADALLPATDIDGTPRPSGAAIDRGAYEVAP